MPRNIRDYDEEIEPKNCIRRTRATAAMSVTDSPLRRNTRSNKQLTVAESSPETCDDSSVQTIGRTTRSRVNTLDKGMADTVVKNLRSRKVSGSSDFSESVEVDEPVEKRVTRSNKAAQSNVGTPTKANLRSRSVRAGSETKSTPPTSRSKRITRSNSVDPVSNLNESTGTPIKRRTRASIVPTEPTVTEDEEIKEKTCKSLECTVMETNESGSEESMVSIKKKSIKNLANTTNDKNINESCDNLEKFTLDSTNKLEESLTHKSKSFNEKIKESAQKSFTTHSVDNALQSSNFKINANEHKTETELPILSTFQNSKKDQNEFSVLNDQDKFYNSRNVANASKNNTSLNDDETEFINVDEFTDLSSNDESIIIIENCNKKKLTINNDNSNIKNSYVKLNRTNTVEKLMHLKVDENVVNDKKNDSINNSISNGNVVKIMRTPIVLVNDIVKSENVSKQICSAKSILSTEHQEINIDNSNNDMICKSNLNSKSVDNNENKNLNSISIHDKSEELIMKGANKNEKLSNKNCVCIRESDKTVNSDTVQCINNEINNSYSINSNNYLEKSILIVKNEKEISNSISVENNDETRKSISININFNLSKNSETVNAINNESECLHFINKNKNEKNNLLSVNMNKDEVENSILVNKNITLTENPLAINIRLAENSATRNITNNGIENLLLKNINENQISNSLITKESDIAKQCTLVNPVDVTTILVSVNDEHDKTEKALHSSKCNESLNACNEQNSLISMKQNHNESSNSLPTSMQINDAVPKSVFVNKTIQSNKIYFNEDEESIDSVSTNQINSEISNLDEINQMDCTSFTKKHTNEVENIKNIVSIPTSVSSPILKQFNDETNKSVFLNKIIDKSSNISFDEDNESVDFVSNNASNNLIKNSIEINANVDCNSDVNEYINMENNQKFIEPMQENVVKNIDNEALLEPMELKILDEIDIDSNESKIYGVDKKSVSSAVTDADGENASTSTKVEENVKLNESDKTPEKSFKKRQAKNGRIHCFKADNSDSNDSAENLFQDIAADEWCNEIKQNRLSNSENHFENSIDKEHNNSRTKSRKSFNEKEKLDSSLEYKLNDELVDYKANKLFNDSLKSNKSSDEQHVDVSMSNKKFNVFNTSSSEQSNKSFEKSETETCMNKSKNNTSSKMVAHSDVNSSGEPMEVDEESHEENENEEINKGKVKQNDNQLNHSTSKQLKNNSLNNSSMKNQIEKDSSSDKMETTEEYENKDEDVENNDQFEKKNRRSSNKCNLSNQFNQSNLYKKNESLREERNSKNHSTDKIQLQNQSSRKSLVNEQSSQNESINKSINKSLNISTKSSKSINNISIKSVLTSPLKDSTAENTDNIDESSDNSSLNKNKKTIKNEDDQNGLNMDKSVKDNISQINSMNQANQSLSKIVPIESNSDNEQVTEYKLEMSVSEESENSEDDKDENNEDIDSDVNKEYNFAGKTIQEFSDDNVPGDECHESEEEFSDPNDDGGDLSDFIVSDDKVTESEYESEDEEEKCESEENGDSLDEKNCENGDREKCKSGNEDNDDSGEEENYETGEEKNCEIEDSEDNENIKIVNSLKQESFKNLKLNVNKSINNSKLTNNESFNQSKSKKDQSVNNSKLTNNESFNHSKSMKDQSVNNSKLTNNESFNRSKSMKDQSFNNSKLTNKESFNHSKSMKDQSVNSKLVKTESFNQSKSLKDQSANNSKLVKNESFNQSKSLKDQSANNSKLVKNESYNQSKSLKDQSVNNSKLVKNESFNQSKSIKDQSVNNSKLIKNESFNHSKSMKDQSINDSKSKSINSNAKDSEEIDNDTLESQYSKTSNSYVDSEVSKKNKSRKSDITNIESASSETESEDSDDSYHIISADQVDTSSFNPSSTKKLNSLIECSTPKPGMTKKKFSKNADSFVERDSLPITSTSNNKSNSIKCKSGSLNELSDTKLVSGRLSMNETVSKSNHDGSVKLKENVEMISSPKDFIKNRQAWKLIPLNQTIQTLTSETPVTKYLKKSKLNDSAPGSDWRNSNCDQFDAFSKKNVSQNKDSFKGIKKIQEINDEPAASSEDKKSKKRKLQDMSNSSSVNDENMLRSAKHKKKRARINESINESSFKWEVENMEPNQVQKEKKKKKKNENSIDAVTTESIEDESVPDIIENAQLTKKKKKNKLKKVKLEEHVLENSPDSEDNQKKKKLKEIKLEEHKLENSLTPEDKHKKKKLKKVKLEEDILENTENSENKKKKKKSKETQLQEHSLESSKDNEKKKKLKELKVKLDENASVSSQSLEDNKQKKKKEKKKTPNQEETVKEHEVNVEEKKRKKQKDNANEEFEQENLHAEKKVKLSLDSESNRKSKKSKRKNRESSNEVDEENLEVSGNADLDGSQPPKKRREKSSEVLKQSRKKKPEELRENVSLNRLPDDVLKNLTDKPVVKNKSKKQKKPSEKAERPSTTMFSPGKKLPVNLRVDDDGYMPLNVEGGTTAFGVVNLEKAKKYSSKSEMVLNFRERMLNRNARQPTAAYLMYLKKQKCKNSI